jgi:hypothetical protein
VGQLTISATQGECLGSQHPEDAICEWDCTRFFDTDVIEEDLGIVGVVLCRESGPGPPRLWCEGRDLSEWVLLIEEEESAPPVFQVVGDLLGRKSVAEESLRMFDVGGAFDSSVQNRKQEPMQGRHHER